MKILLITLPRTGSTSLLKQISTERGLNSISEPFNEVNNNIEKYKKFDWEFTNNICVKTHINHREISFYLDFVKFLNFHTFVLIQSSSSSFFFKSNNC